MKPVLSNSVGDSLYGRVKLTQFCGGQKEHHRSEGVHNVDMIHGHSDLLKSIGSGIKSVHSRRDLIISLSNSIYLREIMTC